MSHVVNCPSGLAIEVRKLKVKEANILADSAGVRRGSTFGDILRACTLAVQEPGIYQLGANGAFDWTKALVADRFYALVQLRVATYGPEYVFDIQCKAQFCREKIKGWEIDLNKDLKFKALPESSKTVFIAGNTFETTIPSLDRKCYFRLQTGEHEAKAAQMAKGRRTEMMTLALATRIHEIAGVHSNDRVRYLDNLDMDDTMALLDAMDEVDGGLDTNIEIECPHCGELNEVSLPFDRGFWLPSKRPSVSMKETEPT